MDTEGTLTGRMESEMELLRRHLEMLKTISQEEPIGIISLSSRLGIPQHRVRYSLRVLEAEGLIKPTSKGAVISGELDDIKSRLTQLLDGICDKSSSMKKTIENL